MLQRYRLADMSIDSLDLKALLITQGVGVHAQVYEKLSGSSRLSPDPMECNTLLLPDGTATHLMDLGQAALLQLQLDSAGGLVLMHRGQFVTDVRLPPASGFYRQKSSRGMPFRGLAVLEGSDVLAFPYLWPCKYPAANATCKFCHCAMFTEQQVKAGQEPPDVFAPEDVAEAVHFAITVEHSARNIEITGGSTLGPDAECAQYLAVLRAIDAKTGLANIPGDMTVLMTPPVDPKAVDPLLEAGVDFIVCSIEVWDQSLAEVLVPGKFRFANRQRHLKALEYIAHSHGRYKACSGFVIGLEPADSVLAAAEHLAARGIVPLPSILLPHGLSPMPAPVFSDMDFFRAIKQGLAAIYDKYQCEPPGELGSNVSAGRDIWNHREEILSQ